MKKGLLSILLLVLASTALAQEVPMSPEEAQAANSAAIGAFQGQRNACLDDQVQKVMIIARLSKQIEGLEKRLKSAETPK